MSHCPSSGCNYQPCSLSQKMSIGMVVAKPHYGSAKEDEMEGQFNTNRQQLNVDEGLKASETPLNMYREHVPAGSASASARTKAGSLTANMPLKHSDHIEKQAFRSTTIGFLDKKPRHSTSMQPGVANKKEGERYEQLSHGDKQSMPFTPMLREHLNKMETTSKQTLRMKLQEILGDVPSASANRRFGKSTTGEVGATEVMQEPTHECVANFKPRQNSDTIETDSDNVDVTIRRPVTRSLNRKRVPARTQPRNSKSKSLSCDKGGHQSNHMFSFEEKSSQPCEVKFGCLRPERTDSAKRSCGIKPGDMQCRVTNVVNTQQVVTGGKKLPPAEEMPLSDRMISPKHACLDENLELEKELLNQSINHSPVIREKVPVPPEESDHHVSFGYQSPLHCDDQLTKSIPKFPLIFSPQINEMKDHTNGSAHAKGGASLEATCKFKSSPVSEEGNSGSSDDAATPEKAYSSIAEPSTEEEEEEEAVNKIYTPDRGEFDSTGELTTPKKVHQEDIYTSPETRVNRKPMLSRTKHHCGHGIDCSDLSPTSHTLKASMTTDDAVMEGLEESPDDEFARVVSLLGSALARVNNKMMSATNKRCSDILMSATEEIHAQLTDAESHIQTDLGKLTSLSKAKRKHMETRLQEQHENLKVIYEKFKEEILNYLQDCRDQMEVQEAQHIELKAATERQKASHRKLLLQADSAVETHLNEAQKRITHVRKLGRQKMLKLKVAIAECLKDGICG